MYDSWLKKEFPFIAACPAVLWQVLFLFIPVTFLLVMSLYGSDPGSSWLTFSHYKSLVSYPYFKSISNACFLAGMTVVGSLLLSFPTAYCIMFYGGRYKLLLLVLLMLPGWTNFIVRVYSWFFLLAQGGPLDTFSTAIGLFPDSVHLLNNHFAELIGMVYCYFPFMMLPLYGALAGIEKNWLEAAADLGANRLEVFASIIFPLSLPGMYIGSVLVFLSAFGEFAIPEILGSGKTIYWGRVVADKFVMFGDFYSGASLTVFGIFCAFLFMSLLGIMSVVIRQLSWKLFQFYCDNKRHWGRQ